VPGKKKGETVEVAIDEHPRADTTIELLQKLKPLFGPQGTITPGNASGLEGEPSRPAGGQFSRRRRGAVHETGLCQFSNRSASVENGN